MKASTASTHAIRWLIRRDMDEVLQIENAAFEHPWLEEEILQLLRKRNAIGSVIESADQLGVHGFMLYELHRDRIELKKIAVDPSRHRQGLGREMIERVIGKLSLQRRRAVEVVVKETDLSSQMFFMACKFKAVQIVKEFDSEDCYVMEYRL